MLNFKATTRRLLRSYTGGLHSEIGPPVNLSDCEPERPLLESAGRSEALLEQAAATSSSTIGRREEVVICLAIAERGEGNTERALEIGAGDVGRREGVGELIFRIEQGPPRIQHLQRRRTA